MSKTKTEDIYKSLSTWNGVCKKLGVDPKVRPGVEGLSKEDADFSIAAYEGKKITEAYNKVDEENGDTSIPNKTPYFWRGDAKGAGFSFRGSDYDSWHSVAATSAAARLCGFRSFAGSNHAGKAHSKVWKMLVHGK